MKIQKLNGPLEFENDGDLSFFTVGVGSAFSKAHFQNNILVIKGKDHILIDCGTLCPYAFHNYKSNITKVKNFLITHSHADHIGGLEEVALMGRYVSKMKPNMVITNNYKRILWQQSLRGGNSYGEMSSTGNYLTFDDYFKQIIPKQICRKPRPLYEVNCGNINLKIFRTKHIPEQGESWRKSFYSLGVLVDERILFPSDTRFDKEMLYWMLEKFPKIEYIFHDCQFFTGGVHASYDELKTLPEDIRKKIILCHISDNYVNYDAKADGFYGFAKQGCYYNFDK
ncbi:MAG: MBL fold metallo-hydrolase [Treponema sp.]|nr:MBL fold metallo-hydrolase [Treponema sp.]